jgi:hypothetical protein
MIASTNIGQVITSVKGKYERKNGFQATNGQQWSTQQCKLSAQCGEIVVLDENKSLKKLNEFGELVEREHLKDNDFDQIESDLKTLFRKSGTSEEFAAKLLKIIGNVIEKSKALDDNKKDQLKNAGLEEFTQWIRGIHTILN